MAGGGAHLAEITWPCPFLGGPAGRDELELHFTLTKVPPKPQVGL